MAKPDKEDYFSKWVPLIKAGNFTNVLAQKEGKYLDGNNALKCIALISELAYDNVKKGAKFDCCPNDILHLTDYFCSLINTDLPKNTSKYLTCLFHISYFFLEKNSLENVSSIFKIIVWIKNNDEKAYQDKAKSLHAPFIALLKNTIQKVITTNSSPDNQSTVPKLFYMLLEMLMVNKTLFKSTDYVQIVLQACQVTGLKDEKAAVYLISASLGLFYKVDKIEHIDLCLPTLIKIYICLFIFQNKIVGHYSALITVENHLNIVQRRFSKDLRNSECLLLLSNTVTVFLCNCTETSLMQKIDKSNCQLQLFQRLKDNDCVIATCKLLATILLHSHKTPKENTPVLPKNGLQPFLQMIFNLCNVLKNSSDTNFDHIKCLAEVFLFISQVETHHSVEELKQCAEIANKVQEEIFSLILEMRSIDEEKAETFTKIVLIRCSNLIREYDLAGLSEEVIMLSKNVCKFICSLPSCTFEQPNNKTSAENCFSFLVNTLGIKQVEQSLECIVALVVKCPQSISKAFKIWGNLKHNTVCAEKDECLDLTVWGILSNTNSTLLNEWSLTKIGNSEIANLLIQELRTYFLNKTLRGKPVIAAIDALQNLNTDCLTQVKGLVIAMDVASASEQFPNECLAYYTKSKSLIIKLRKEKKNFDTVDFNCCMGDLLYAQLRCQLKHMRMDCETEMVRLSAITQEPPREKEMPEDRLDPNDTCNLNIKYNNICLPKQRQLMEYLDSALRHWGFACSMLEKIQNCEYDLLVTLRNLHDAGLLLKLYCDEIKQTKVWRLLYNMATAIGDIDMIVTAVGELQNITEDIDEEWLKSTTNMLKNPNLSEKVRRNYLMNNAIWCLKNNKINDGLKILIDLESEVKKSSIQYTQYLVIVGEYQKLRDWKKYKCSFNFSTTYHFSFHKAITHLIYAAEHQKWGMFSESCQINLQLLHVSRLFGEANWILKQPREARVYLKSQLPLAQKLALPLRTVQIVLLLAWVDLFTGTVDDCAVKLESLEDLLELCGTPVVYGKSTSPAPLNKTVLLVPEYLSHTPCCNCLPCTTLEYRRLVLETITLRASFCANFGQLDDALQCLEVAKLVEAALCSSENGVVLQSCAYMWLRYAEVMAVTGRCNEAIIANSNALRQLPQQELNRFQHIHQQQFSLNMCQLSLRTEPISGKVNSEVETTPTKTKKIHGFNTPDNITQGKSPLVVKNENITPITPFARPAIPFKLGLSGEENSPVVASKTKRKVKQTSKLGTETPNSVNKTTKVFKTPFVIVDDDGKPIGKSIKKTISNVKNKNISKSSKNTEKPKKKLFTCNKSDSSSDSLSDLPPLNFGEEIMRKSNRPGIKTYTRRKQPPQRTNSNDDQNIKQENKNINEESIFEFGQFKDVIDKLEIKEKRNISKKTNSVKSSSNLPVQKNKFENLVLAKTDNSRSRNIVSRKQCDDNSDCDLIEGTPPNPQKKTSFVSNYKQ